MLVSVWYCAFQIICFLKKYQINIFIGVFCNVDMLILKIKKIILIKTFYKIHRAILLNTHLGHADTKTMESHQNP